MSPYPDAWYYEPEAAFPIYYLLTLHQQIRAAYVMDSWRRYLNTVTAADYMSDFV